MNRFHTSESGAVTVDWVVLTAGLVGLGFATMAVVSTGVQDAATDTEAQMSGVLITGFRNSAGMANQTFFDARNAHIAQSGGEPLAWADHLAHHANLDDASFSLQLASFRAAETTLDPADAAIQAYVDSGYDPALASAIRMTMVPESSAQDAQAWTDATLASFGSEGFAEHLQLKNDKNRARLAYYEAEAERRGL